MLQIEIDGKQVSVEQGATVIEAAHKLGTYIPHFCYHKKLSIAANCRMCLVDVEKAPKPLPACATPVTDGMIVRTHSAKAREAQEGVMEFLLINHPLDCPTCDQGGECQLQDLAMGYGKPPSRYTEEKRSVVGKDMGPLVSAEEMSRCIHCTRCVRFTEEIAGLQEIAMANRGEHSEIMPFIGKAVETELSGNVIDLCPVGALTSKPFRFNARTWELNRRKSVSAHDALGSNLIVQTKDHTVRRVLPLENEAINECWLSDRDRFAYEGLYHESRLKNPKIKQGGEWMDVDWKTALEYVRSAIECIAKDGNQNQVGVWANPMNTVEELYLAKKLADGLGVKNFATRLRQQDKRLSDGLKGAQWLGQSIESLADNDAVLVVGANLRKEQPLLTARLRRAAKDRMALSVLASSKEELFMPLLSQEAAHPDEWAGRLKKIQTALRIDFSLSVPNACSEMIPDELPLYLGSELSKSSELLFLMAAECAGVVCHSSENPKQWCFPLASKPEHIGFSEEEALSFDLDKSVSAFRILQEYALLPEKFLFVLQKNLKQAIIQAEAKGYLPKKPEQSEEVISDKGVNKKIINYKKRYFSLSFLSFPSLNFFITSCIAVNFSAETTSACFF